MDIALKKLDLIQRLMQVWDEATLQRIAKTIAAEVPETDMDMTDEDWAELDRRRAEQVIDVERAKRDDRRNLRDVRDGMGMTRRRFPRERGHESGDIGLRVCMNRGRFAREIGDETSNVGFRVGVRRVGVDAGVGVIACRDRRARASEDGIRS